MRGEGRRGEEEWRKGKGREGEREEKEGGSEGRK